LPQLQITGFRLRGNGGNIKSSENTVSSK